MALMTNKANHGINDDTHVHKIISTKKQSSMQCFYRFYLNITFVKLWLHNILWLLTYYFSTWKKMFLDLNNKFSQQCNLFGCCDKPFMYYLSNQKVIRVVSNTNGTNGWKMEFLGFHITA